MPLFANSRLKTIMLPGAIIIGAIFFLGYFLKDTGVSQKLPAIDLHYAEPQVAAKIQRLADSVRTNPGDDKRWGRLAINLAIHGFYAESIPCFQEAHRLNKKEFRWPYLCAYYLYSLSNPESVKWYEKALAIKKNSAQLYISYGEALLRNNELSNAETAFRKALTLDPNLSHAYVGLAQIEYTQKAYKPAIANLQKAINMNPRHREAFALLAACYRQLGDQNKTLYYTAQMRNLPENTPMQDPILARLRSEGVSAHWYRERGRELLDRGAYEAAAAQFRKALAIKEDPVTYNNLGIALLRQNQLAPAIENFQKAVALKPGKAEFLNNLGVAINKQGNFEKGIRYIKQAFDLDPGNTDVCLTLARQYIKKSRWREALAAYRQGLSAAPENIYISFHLAWLLATAPQENIRDGKTALKMAQKMAQAADYRNPKILDVLAAAYAETGNFKEAAEWIERAIELSRQRNDQNFVRILSERKQRYLVNRPWRVNADGDDD